MSNFKFKSKNESFYKEKRLIHWNPFSKSSVPGRVWESIGKLADVTSKLLDGALTGIEWALQLPEKTRRFVTKTYYKIKYGVDNWKTRIKSPGNPSHLDVYGPNGVYIEKYFKHPQKYKIPGADFDTNLKTNHGLYAALYHRQLLYLQYLVHCESKFYENAMKEYKRLSKALVKFRKEQIKRRKKVEWLKIQLQEVESWIRGSIHEEDDTDLTGDSHQNELDADLIEWKAKRRDILSKIKINSREIYPIETRGKYTTRKVLISGSKTPTDQFIIDPSQKVTKNIHESMKEIEGMVSFKKHMKNMSTYNREIEILAYWREKSAKSAQPSEKTKFEQYKLFANQELAANERRFKITPVP